MRVPTTALLAVLALLISIPAAADWPMYQFDAAHSVYTADFGPQAADLLWDWDPDVYVSRQGPPVVADGRVYFIVNEYPYYPYFYAKIICRDTETGDEIWRYHRGDNAEIDRILAIADGRIYFCSSVRHDSYYPVPKEDTLHCHDIVSGSEIWSSTWIDDGDFQSPVVANGIVYITATYWNYDVYYNKLRAFDAEDGTSLWSIVNYMELRQYWMPCVHQGRVYTAINYESILCVDALSGETVWERILTPQNWGNATAYEDKVFYSLDNGDMVALDAGTGETVWTRTGGTGSLAVSPDGSGYISGDNGSVICIDTASGDVIWARFLSRVDLMRPTIATNFLYVWGGGIYNCLDATTGDTVWSQSISGRGPAISGGRIYFTGDGGEIFCYGSSVPPQQTVAAQIGCDSQVGLESFDATMNLAVSNLSVDGPRRFAYQVNLTEPDGSTEINWKRGWQNVLAGDKWITSFSHTLPLLPENWGSVIFEVEAVDVTPAPYNQPPYPPAGAVAHQVCSTELGVVDASLACVPSYGTLPFVSLFSVSMTNNYIAQARRLHYGIAITLANDQYFPNWRRGWQNVPANQTHSMGWWQNLPAYNPLIGVNNFDLTVIDVTPAPYNLPPYPSAGDTANDSCTITASEAP